MRFDINDFPWGKVVKVHDIGGRFKITEYIDEQSGETAFSTGTLICPSFEQALLECVCHHYNPEDFHLFGYALRLIAGEDKE